MIKINNVELGSIFMAPLAGVTDRAFRELVTEYGADLAFNEMVSAKALHYNSENTKKLLNLARNTDKCAIQLFGSEKDIMGEIAEKFNDIEKIKVIDINMGCPAPKIVKNGEGSALMKDPLKASAIIEEIKKKSNKIVSVKFRRGYEMDNETALSFAKMAEESGADYITVHGRYRDQFYSGDSDREIIRKIKEKVSIPVVGNGDIFTGEDALTMFKETGCDAVMVARGALGNPFIFKEIKEFLKGQAYTKPSNSEKINVAMEHYKEAVAEHGEHVAVREMRKHLGWYVKGMKDSTELKNQLNVLNNAEEVLKLLEKYRDSL